MKPTLTKFIKIVSIVISSYSFIYIADEWNKANVLNNVLSKSYFTLMLITFILICICNLFIFVLNKVCNPYNIIYELYISILYGIASYVWTKTIEMQVIINSCGNIITVGAPKWINWTCIETCNIGIPEEHHNLPFITSDAISHNATKYCKHWFKDDSDSLIWTTTLETVFFTAMLLHCCIYLTEKNNCFLVIIDYFTLLATSGIAFVPKSYYSIYNIGGVIRFLGLLHFIQAIEKRIKTKQLIGLIMVMKISFIALTGAAIMFVAEKPCHALHDNCDSDFEYFGDTLYFVFVTLSTVGFGDMSPNTDAGKISIVVIIMASISYLPNIIADVVEMCKANPIHDRLDQMHKDIKQVGFFMNGGTRRKRQRLAQRLKQKSYHRHSKNNIELQSLLQKEDK